MTTLDRPSGHLQIRNPGTTQVVRSGGSVVCRLPVQDYIPVAVDQMTLWLDMGDGSGATVRQDGPRAASGVWTLGQRASAGGGGGFSLDLNPGLLGRQGGRNVLTFGKGSSAAASPGLQGSLGTTQASWTVGVFGRIDRLVNSWGAFLGKGTVSNLLSCTPIFVLPIPSGGSVPAAACAVPGGPLEGTEAGVPWDVACLNVWRLITLTNDAVAGTRTLAVNGVPVTVSPGARPLL